MICILVVLIKFRCSVVAWVSDLPKSSINMIHLCYHTTTFHMKALHPFFPQREKIHLGEEVPPKLIHFSPFFGQILQIYIILDLFLTFFFFSFLTLRLHFFRGKKFKSRNRGEGKISAKLNFIYQCMDLLKLFYAM